MLHIVNGDSVADKLKQGALEGEILVWREIYSEGPIFVQPEDGANRTLRAEQLENLMGIPRAEYVTGCEKQGRRIAQLADGEEVVLWFEHDLFDQTMLSRLLHLFSQQPRDRVKLNLLCIGSFPGVEPFHGLGQLNVEQLYSLAGTWRPVGEDELELGKRLWEAYAFPEPLKLHRLLQEDTSALPFAKDAYRFHLSRLPSVENGLGIVEQTTLELVRGGVERPHDLFRQAGDRLHRFGMGDLQFWSALKRMAEGEKPLLRIEGDASIPSFADPSPAFRNNRVMLTDTGLAVLNGQMDQVAVNGMDCWLGGVRLQGNGLVWRWDRKKEVPVRA